MGWEGEPSFFKSPLCLYQNGFTLHAERSLKAGQRRQLEDLLRYMARPPLCDQRMRELENGDVEITLKRPFSDGTRAIKFTPLELLEKIAAFIPPIWHHLVIYGGVFAGHSKWRASVIINKREGQKDPNKSVALSYTWAALLKRVFDIDMDCCPRCGGAMRTLAVIRAPPEVGRILVNQGVGVADARVATSKDSSNPASYEWDLETPF